MHPETRHGENKKFKSNHLLELSLPGLKCIFDQKSSIVKRIVWGSLWLTALICCTVQCTVCTINFFSNPVSVNVKYKLENDTIIAPLITLCPKDYKSRNLAVSPKSLAELSCSNSYKSAAELLSKCNLTIEGLWNISRFQIEDLQCHAFTNVDWVYGIDAEELSASPQYAIQEMELPTVRGLCLTFKAKSPVSCLGSMTGLHIVYTSAGLLKANATYPFYSIMIHSEAEIPLVQYFGATRIGISSSFIQSSTISVRVVEVVHVNTLSNPCHSEEDYVKCQVQCVEKRIIAASKGSACRLPYMVGMTHLTPCRTDIEFLDMYKATEFAVTQVTRDSCNCGRPCIKIQYTQDYIASYPTKKYYDLFVTLPRCDIEVIEDELIYGFAAFFSDIGGALGLFLGMSILNICEILEIFLCKLFRF